MAASLAVNSDNSNNTNYTPQSPLDNAGLIDKWIHQIHDRRGFSIEQLNRWCGPRDSGKPIELWLPSELATPDDRRACWGADPFSRLHPSIARPVTRASRFMNRDGSVFQVAFEVKLAAGEWIGGVGFKTGGDNWIPINQWLEAKNRELGDRLWSDWAIENNKRSCLGKYLSPVGGGYSPVWLPALPLRSMVDPVAAGGNKTVEKLILEGPWKAVAIWESGVPAAPCCLAGVDAGVVGSGKSDPEKGLIAGRLRPEVKPLLAAGKVVIAFDQDSRPSTIKNVARAVDRLSSAILKERARAKISAWEWDGSLGKGIDDLIATTGRNWTTHIKPVSIGRIIGRGEAIKLTREPDQTVIVPDGKSLADVQDSIAKTGHKINILWGATGVGKTEFLVKRSEGKKMVYLSPRVSLGRSAAVDFDATYRADLPKLKGFKDENGDWIQLTEIPEQYRLTACLEGFESLPVNLLGGEGSILFNDEADQILTQLFNGQTLRGKQRAAWDFWVWANNAFEEVWLVSAGISDDVLTAIEEVTGERPYLIEAKRETNERLAPIEVLEGCDWTAVIDRMVADVAAGKPVLFACDSRRKIEQIGEMIAQDFVDQNGLPSRRTLAITSKTIGTDPDAIAATHGKMRFLRTEQLNGRTIYLVLYSPTWGTGYSLIEDCPEDPYFKAVYGVFFGAVDPEGARQMLARYRSDIPRVIWSKAKATKRGRKSAQKTAKGVLGETIEGSKIAAKKSGQAYFDLLAAAGKFDIDKASPYLWQWARSLASENRSRAFFRECLIGMLELSGHKVTRVTAESKSEISARIKDIETVLDEAAARRILKAEKLTESQYLELEKKEVKSLDDHDKIDRYKIEDGAMIDLSNQSENEAIRFILDWERGSRLSRLRNLARAIGFATMHLRTDRDSIDRVIAENEGVWAVSQNKAIHDVLRGLKIRQLINKGTWKKTDPIVQQIADAASRHGYEKFNLARKLLRLEKVSPVNPVGLINAILKSLDLRIVTEKLPDGSRQYSIDSDYFAESKAILDRRFQRWQEKLAEREAAAAEKLATEQQDDLGNFDAPIEQPIDPIPNEPIADPVVETVAAIAQPAQPAQPEFWQVCGGAHDGDRVRIDGSEKDGWIRVSPVGKFGSFKVTPDQLKPIAPVATAAVATDQIEDRQLKAELAIAYAFLNRPRGKGWEVDPNHYENEAKEFEVISAATQAHQAIERPIAALEPLWDWVWGGGAVETIDSLDIDSSIKDWLKEPPFKGYSPITAIRAAAHTLAQP